MKKEHLFVAVLLIAASFLADSSINAFAKTIHTPPLDFVFGWFSHFATIFVILIVMTSLFLWEEKKKKWIKPLWLSFFGAFILSYAIKFIIMRARPDGTEIIPLLNLIDYSFPSAHAAAAFSIIPLLDKEYKKLKWFWLLFAIMVVASRLYFGVHYLSDVMAGAAIGYIFGYEIVEISTKRKK